MRSSVTYTLADVGAGAASLTVTEVLSEEYGAYIWPSAVVLAAYARCPHVLPENAAVLELGCGVGLPGIAVAVGHPLRRVVLTDTSKESAWREALTESLAANGLGGDVPSSTRVMCLDWGSRGAFDRFCDEIINEHHGDSPINGSRGAAAEQAQRHGGNGGVVKERPAEAVSCGGTDAAASSSSINVRGGKSDTPPQATSTPSETTSFAGTDPRGVPLPFDVVLAADCLFDTAVLEPFLYTLSLVLSRCRAGACAFITYHRRDDSHDVDYLFQKWGLRATRVQEDLSAVVDANVSDGKVPEGIDAVALWRVTYAGDRPTALRRGIAKRRRPWWQRAGREGPKRLRAQAERTAKAEDE